MSGRRFFSSIEGLGIDCYTKYAHFINCEKQKEKATFFHSRGYRTLARYVYLAKSFAITLFKFFNCYARARARARATSKLISKSIKNF